MCQFQSPNPSHHFPPWYPYVWSLHLCLYFCFGIKIMTNLDSIFKSRDNTLSTKVCLIKAMVFPVVMYGCESWTIKKAESWRIDAFELWCWRRLLKVPWTAKWPNQSIVKEISPEYSLEGLMLSWNSNTLATGCEEPTYWKRPWCWKDWGQKEKGATENKMVAWHRCLNGHKLDRETWHAEIHRVTNNLTWFTNWTVTTMILFNVLLSLICQHFVKEFYIYIH